MRRSPARVRISIPHPLMDLFTEQEAGRTTVKYKKYLNPILGLIPASSDIGILWDAYEAVLSSSYFIKNQYLNQRQIDKFHS